MISPIPGSCYIRSLDQATILIVSYDRDSDTGWLLRCNLQVDPPIISYRCIILSVTVSHWSPQHYLKV